MEDDLTRMHSSSSRSLANPRRVRLLAAYRDGQLVPTVRRPEQPPPSLAASSERGSTSSGA